MAFPHDLLARGVWDLMAYAHGWGNDEDEMNAVAEAAHMPYTGEGLTWRRDRSGAHDDDAAAVVDLTDGEQQQASASSTASTGSTQSLTTTAGAGAGATEIAASSGPPGSRRARRLARKRARQEAAREAEASASSEGGTAGGGGAGGGAGAGAGTAASSSASASSSTAAAAGAGKQKAPRKRQRVAKAADGSLPGQDGNLLMHNGEIIAQLVKQLRCSICLDVMTNMTSTRCGHVFCGDCIRAALRTKNQCPLCNKKVTRQMIHPIFL